MITNRTKKQATELCYCHIIGYYSALKRKVQYLMQGYIVKAPDEELYQTLLVEFKHAKKNKCQVYPLTNEDREETANAKTKMILAAYNTPYQGKAISSQKVEEITKKILENYKKNGGDMNKIAIMSGLKTGYLTSADKCQVMTDFFEATFSLPKKETVMFYRANGQYFTM